MAADTPGAVETRLRAQLEAMQRWSLKEKSDLLTALEKRFGPEVRQVVDEVVEKQVRRGWSQISARQQTHTIQDLINLLWKPVQAQGFEFDIQSNDQGVLVTCTRCPAYERAGDVGALQWGYRFHCATDQHIVAAFNDNIGYRRTQTLMEGHESCDHFYYMKSTKQ